MKILTIRTDNPEAEIGLYDDKQLIASVAWQAHRQLSDTVHIKLNALLSGHKTSLKDLGGIVIFRGPGSFTGLRIGFSVANALASSLEIPIVTSDGESWQAEGVSAILNGANEHIALPQYGSPPNITAPRS